MLKEYDCCNFKMSLEEVEDGFKVYVKGDKEVLRPKLEAMEAWINYQEKARAAGWPTGHGGHKWHSHSLRGFHRMEGQGSEKFMKFMKHMHKGFRNAVEEIKKD